MRFIRRDQTSHIFEGSDFPIEEMGVKTILDLKKVLEQIIVALPEDDYHVDEVLARDGSISYTLTDPVEVRYVKLADGD